MTRSIIATALAFLLAASTVAEPLPGQVVIHPDNDQVLAYHLGGPILLVGPGDPETFFHHGTRNPDGTRTGGDQDDIIDRLITHGGNTLYTTLIHPGNMNPFVNGLPSSMALEPAILDQWNGWLDRMEAANIIAFMCLYDDDFDFSMDMDGDASDLELATFPGIVDAFEHHRNVMWAVCEESTGRMSVERIDAVGDIIAAADDHQHVLYDHHWNWGWPYGFDEFVSQDSDSINSWAIEIRRDHLDNNEPDGLHDLLLDMRARSTEHGYGLNLSEIFSEDRDDHMRPGGPHGSGYVMRWTNWTAAMSGTQGVMVLWMFVGRGNRTSAQLDADLQYCRIQQQFFESTDFDTMEPNDDLGLASTNFVLANPPVSYIGYRHSGSGDMGIRGLLDGEYELDWIDPVTGTRITQSALALSGDAVFSPPGGFGAEAAFWLRTVTDTDVDGVVDAIDNCIDTPNPDQLDEDEDGAGDGCDPCPRDPVDDADADGACGDVDNCPDTANADQADGDADALGDACDACPLDPENDVDGDTICGEVDNCPDSSNRTQGDLDGDGTGDACDVCPFDDQDDADGDGFCANFDNCPDDANPLQVDLDADGQGDACDVCPLDPMNTCTFDGDGDGIVDIDDNCPDDVNPMQEDADSDGLGDDCDPCPLDPGNTCGIDADGDGIADVDDCAPLDPDNLVPSSASGLRVAIDPMGYALSWVAPDSGWSADARHALIRGDLSELLADRGFDRACVTLGDDGASWVFGEPVRSEYYLVQGNNPCGDGPLLPGSPARTGLRALDLPACP
ncbi:MAG: thrombospondin type 3 repeat-containing protein [Acidobacteriota bacterium]